MIYVFGFGVYGLTCGIGGVLLSRDKEEFETYNFVCLISLTLMSGAVILM